MNSNVASVKIASMLLRLPGDPEDHISTMCWEFRTQIPRYRFPEQRTWGTENGSGGMQCNPIRVFVSVSGEWGDVFHDVGSLACVRVRVHAPSRACERARAQHFGVVVRMPETLGAISIQGGRELPGSGADPCCRPEYAHIYP